VLQDVLAEVFLGELADIQPQLLDLLAAAREQRLVATRQFLERVKLGAGRRLGLQLAQFQFRCLGSQLRQDLLAGLSRAEMNEDVVHFRAPDAM
jgi:hypothetical protein